MLVLFYVLLFLAVIIALIGIANTMALSIHERTRELGLLRAVGESRRQVRSTIRWEAVIIALLGHAARPRDRAVLRVGGDRGAAGRRASRSSRPRSVQLVVIVVFGGFAAVLAAILPGTRARRSSTSCTRSRTSSCELA